MQSIFVTGAASGIGRATAKLFASQGWFVGLYDRDEAGITSLRAEIGEAKCTSGRLDVTDLGEFRRSVAAFGSATSGHMDVLFNNAGILRMGRFEDVPPEDAHLEVAVNVGGVINGIYAALPLLEKTKGSLILNMSSASAIYGTPDHSVYSATKFAVRGLTEALDIELRDKGVRVADIMPGYVSTPMVFDQKTKSKMLDVFGFQHTPEDVAEIAWRAAKGGRLHWIPQANHKVFVKLQGFESLARMLMRRFAGM